MRLVRWRLALALTLLFGIGFPAAPPAAAMVILGGGAAIVVNGDSYCTLTTIGRDRFGDVVGFTASQCGGPGATVAVSATQATVGTVVAVNNDLRYAVIRFDAPDLIPVSDYAGIGINGIGPDPVYNSFLCKWGPAAPGICGLLRRDGWPRAAMIGEFDAGDLGAPVTMDGQLVGLVYDFGILPGGRYGPTWPLTYFTRFNAILADLNANDGPGSGFVPIGS
ncbi:serine protease [Mycolicibacter minnesotensis]